MLRVTVEKGNCRNEISRSDIQMIRVHYSDSAEIAEVWWFYFSIRELIL